MSRSKRHQNKTIVDELRCNLVIWKAPTPAAETPVKGTGGGKGKVAVGAAQQEKQEKALIRGNTVSGYWELNRQVSPHRRSV
jgi:hypothetical protein